MSWRYSQALAAEYLAGTCSDGELSALSKRMTTPPAYCSPDRMTACSRLSRFGMTYEPLTDGLGADVLTWFLAGFPARTSALQEKGQDLAASVPASGPKWLASWAKYDRDTSSWKTAQLSFLEGLGASSVTWPRSGLMRRGECYPLATVAHGMSARGSGLLPTLVADDTISRTKPYAQGGTPLSLAVKQLPTLTVCGNYNRKGASKNSGDGLHTMLATLCARDYRHPGRSRFDRTGSKAGDPLPQQIGGPLNPTWCEWYMGVPEGWTEFAALGISKYHEWRQQHSPNSAEPLSKAA